jgi:hypothetical protein
LNSFNRYHFCIYIHVYTLSAPHSSSYPFPHHLAPPTCASPAPYFLIFISWSTVYLNSHRKTSAAGDPGNGAIYVFSKWLYCKSCFLRLGPARYDKVGVTQQQDSPSAIA